MLWQRKVITTLSLIRIHNTSYKCCRTTTAKKAGAKKKKLRIYGCVFIYAEESVWSNALIIPFSEICVYTHTVNALMYLKTRRQIMKEKKKQIYAKTVCITEGPKDGRGALMRKRYNCEFRMGRHTENDTPLPAVSILRHIIFAALLQCKWEWVWVWHGSYSYIKWNIDERVAFFFNFPTFSRSILLSLPFQQLKWTLSVHILADGIKCYTPE